jgi:hypothetical protein
VVEGARLESVFRGHSNVGSNPTLSASLSGSYRFYGTFAWNLERTGRRCNFFWAGRQADRRSRGRFRLQLSPPDKPVPALVIKLSDSQSFELFVQDGTVNLLSMGGTTRFVSIFQPVANGFPTARVYTLDVPDLFDFAGIAMSFRKRGFRLVHMHPQEFHASLHAGDYQLRTAEYRSA